MINLHAHTVLSDGELVASELIRRFEALRWEAVAITDHVDESNVDFIIPSLITACRSINQTSQTKALVGVEITHVKPPRIAALARQARLLGAQIILVHGETLVEPVTPGTNRAALRADIDVLVHPGMVSEADVKLAAKRKIALEISTRRGHCYTNGHVAKLAKRHRAPLAINLDAHAPEDILPPHQVADIAKGAGLSAAEVGEIYRSMKQLVERNAREGGRR